MTNQIAELMARYNEYRQKWIEQYGKDFDESAFHAWFTEQAAMKETGRKAHQIAEQMAND